MAAGCVPYQVAQDGVLVVQFGERGSSHCYDPEDIMTSTATWIGQTEFKDYDFVLGLLVRGGVPGVPRVDGTRIGLSGSSHGGIESLLYVTGSTTFDKFALVMPEVGTADLWTTWGAWTFDPTFQPSAPGPAGLVPIAGNSPQMHAYPGSTYTQVFKEALSTGNWTSVSEFMAARTAFDTDGGLKTFHNRAENLIMHTGGRDCSTFTLQSIPTTTLRGCL